MKLIKTEVKVLFILIILTSNDDNAKEKVYDNKVFDTIFFFFHIFYTSQKILSDKDCISACVYHIKSL